MYYPWLDVPVLTGPCLAAITALTHIFFVLCSVGIGVLLTLENGRALKAEETKYRVYLRRHARQLATGIVPLTLFTGLGFWFASGLTSPRATEELVHVFAFSWGVGWCLLLVCLVTSSAGYYFWDKASAGTSRLIWRVYTLTSWLVLALSTAISAFTLNSAGIVKDWESTGSMWHALLNWQSMAQTVARTGAALALGAAYFMLNASRFDKDANIRERVVKRMRLWLFIGLFLIVAGAVGGVFTLTDSSSLALERIATHTGVVLSLAGFIGALILLTILGPCLRPRDFNPGQSAALLLLVFVSVGEIEYIRAAIRSPYDVDRVVYQNQLSRADIATTRSIGLLYFGTWTTFALDALQDKYDAEPEEGEASRATSRPLKISAARYLNAESIHLAPPPEPEPEEEDDDEEEGEEEENSGAASPDEEEDPNAGLLGLTFDSEDEESVASESVRVAYFHETAAQQSLADVGRNQPQNGYVSAPLDDRFAQSPSLVQQPALGAPQNSGLAPSAQPAGNQRSAQSAQGLQSPATSSGSGPAGAVGGGSGPSAAVGDRAGRVNVQRGGTRPGASRPSGSTSGASALPAESDSGLTADASTPAAASGSSPASAVNQREATRATSRGLRAGAGAAASSSAIAPPAASSEVASVAAEPHAELAATVDDASKEGAEEGPAKSNEVLDAEVFGPIGRGNEDLLLLDSGDRLTLGQMVFQHQCACCHAAGHGVNAVGPLVSGLSASELKSFATRLNYSHYSMPPWAGTEVEAELLAEYLERLAPRTPKNVFMKDKPKEAPKEKPEKPKGKKKSSKKSEDDSSDDESEEEETEAGEEDDLLGGDLTSSLDEGSLL